MLALAATSRLTLLKTYNPALRVHEKPPDKLTPAGKASGEYSPGPVGQFPLVVSSGGAGGTAAGSGATREGSGSSDRSGNVGAGVSGFGCPVVSSSAGSHGPHSGGRGWPDSDRAIELTPNSPPKVAGTCCTGNFTRT